MKQQFNDDQVEALSDLYLAHGYNMGICDVLFILKKELGNTHKITTQIRIELVNKKAREIMDKASILIDNSNLHDILINRLNYEKSI